MDRAKSKAEVGIYLFTFGVCDAFYYTSLLLVYEIKNFANVMSTVVPTGCPQLKLLLLSTSIEVPIFRIIRSHYFLQWQKTLCNKIRSTFCTRLKIWIFKDFSELNTIDTFILACKLGKTAKNAIEVGKNALLPPFWTYLTQKGEKGGPN